MSESESLKHLVDCMNIGQSHNLELNDNIVINSWHQSFKHTNIVCYAVYKGINFKLGIEEDAVSKHKLFYKITFCESDSYIPEFNIEQYDEETKERITAIL